MPPCLCVHGAKPPRLCRRGKRLAEVTACSGALLGAAVRKTGASCVATWVHASRLRRLTGGTLGVMMLSVLILLFILYR